MTARHHLCRYDPRRGRNVPLCKAAVAEALMHSDHELKRGRIDCPTCLRAYPDVVAREQTLQAGRGLAYHIRSLTPPVVLPDRVPSEDTRRRIIRWMTGPGGGWNVRGCCRWLGRGGAGTGRLPRPLAAGTLALALSGSVHEARARLRTAAGGC